VDGQLIDADVCGTFNAAGPAVKLTLAQTGAIGQLR
jgi:hypothetical protein